MNTRRYSLRIASKKPVSSFTSVRRSARLAKKPRVCYKGMDCDDNEADDVSA